MHLIVHTVATPGAGAVIAAFELRCSCGEVFTATSQEAAVAEWTAHRNGSQ